MFIFDDIFNKVLQILTMMMSGHSYYHDKILSIERAAMKSWSEYTTEELKLEKLIK